MQSANVQSDDGYDEQMIGSMVDRDAGRPATWLHYHRTSGSTDSTSTTLTAPSRHHLRHDVATSAQVDMFYMEHHRQIDGIRENFAVQGFAPHHAMHSSLTSPNWCREPRRYRAVGEQPAIALSPSVEYHFCWKWSLGRSRFRIISCEYTSDHIFIPNMMPLFGGLTFADYVLQSSAPVTEIERLKSLANQAVLDTIRRLKLMLRRTITENMCSILKSFYPYIVGQKECNGSPLMIFGGCDSWSGIAVDEFLTTRWMHNEHFSHDVRLSADRLHYHVLVTHNVAGISESSPAPSYTFAFRLPTMEALKECVLRGTEYSLVLEDADLEKYVELGPRASSGSLYPSPGKKGSLDVIRFDPNSIINAVGCGFSSWELGPAKCKLSTDLLAICFGFLEVSDVLKLATVNTHCYNASRKVQTLCLANYRPLATSKLDFLFGRFTHIRSLSLVLNDASPCVSAFSELKPTLQVCKVYVESVRLQAASSLKGMEVFGMCKQLDTLWLGGSAICDVSPLATCRALKQLVLHKTQVIDLRPLQACEKLKELHIIGCLNAVDRSSQRIAQIPNLERLYVSDLEWRSISGLCDLASSGKLSEIYLRNLTKAHVALSCDDGETDPLRLCKVLDMAGNALVTRETLMRLRLHSYAIARVNLEDCSQLSPEPLPMICNPKLMDLRVGGTNVTSLRGLEVCRSLVSLDVQRTQVADLGLIVHCPNIKILNICRTPVNKLNALARCCALQRVDCSGTRIRDLCGLENCKYLIILNVSVCKNLVDIESLPTQSLLSFDASGCSRLANANVLSRCKVLRTVDLSRTSVTNLVNGNTATSLSIQDLRLDGTPIESIKDLPHLPELLKLSMRSTKLIDMKEIASRCKNIEFLDLSLSSIRCSDLLHLKSCPQLCVVDVRGSNALSSSYSRYSSKCLSMLRKHSKNCRVVTSPSYSSGLLPVVSGPRISAWLKYISRRIGKSFHRYPTAQTTMK